MEVESALEGLLATFPELKLHAGKGVVVCSLSHHEMPGRAEVVRAYVDGKKFRTLKAEKDFDFGRLQPYIIPSRKRKRQLFCALTNRYMNRKPAEVELHLKGKRYRRALDNYNAGRLSLFEERFGKKWPAGNTAAVGNKEEEMEGERKEEGNDRDEEEKEEISELPPVSTMKSRRVVHHGVRRKGVELSRCSGPPTKRRQLHAVSGLKHNRAKHEL
ncbi:Surfeit locus protein 2, partial [Geodia barretti]